MVQSAAHFTHKSLTGIDIAIIVVYFIVIFAIGFYFARKERTSTDYFLASRSVGWFAIGRRCSSPIFQLNISLDWRGRGAPRDWRVGAFCWGVWLLLLCFCGGFFRL